MNITVARSSASAVNTTLPWRGMRFGMPLPRCVKAFAPAAMHGSTSSKRDGYAGIGDRLDELRHSRDLRRDRHQPDQSATGILEPVEELKRRRPHPLQRMGADRAWLRGDERTFKMDAQDAPFTPGIPASRLRNHSHICKKHFRIASDEGRQITRRSIMFKALGDGNHLFNRETGRIEVNATVSVYLKIDPFRLHPQFNLSKNHSVPRRPDGS